MSQYPQELRDMLARFTLMDDDFMTAVFHDNIPATQLILRIILEKPDLVVQQVKTQEKLKNLAGRSLTLDVLATDASGIPYNIEVQNAPSGALPKRARYHLSLLDAAMLPSGNDFSALRETYVVFITRTDVLGKGLPLYHIDRMIRETNDPFGDGSHILYVNGRNRSNTPLGQLMQDFNQPDAAGFHYRELAEPVHYLKNTIGGAEKMCAMMEEYGDTREERGRIKGIEEGMQQGLEQGMQQGMQQGQADASRNMAQSLLLLGVNSPEQIALVTRLPIEEIHRMAEEIRHAGE